MRLLLDTHTYLWATVNPSKLSERAALLIEDPDNQVFVSMVSAWEIAIKSSIGKLTLRKPIAELFTVELSEYSFESLPIRLTHIARVSTLRFHHRDPFDRLLIAQAMIEQHAVVSCDGLFDQYGIARLW